MNDSLEKVYTKQTINIYFKINKIIFEKTCSKNLQVIILFWTTLLQTKIKILKHLHVTFCFPVPNPINPLVMKTVVLSFLPSGFIYRTSNSTYVQCIRFRLHFAWTEHGILPLRRPSCLRICCSLHFPRKHNTLFYSLWKQQTPENLCSTSIHKFKCCY